ncbi:MAG TPA: hypothetical protein VJR04_13485 [Terriglobales bacterium]|nr:hypothetical protein [Terriglobales bacterium]
MRIRSLTLVAVLIVTSAPLWSQIHDRDPLTDAEVDQLRETAIEPEKRLKLMVDFTKARMTSLEQVRTDPKAKDRGKRMHDLLEDISTLVDEIDDNVDDYNERSADLRKPLKQVVEMDSDFQTKLHELKNTENDPKNIDEASDYKFALDDAIESIDQSAATNRKLLDEQNVKFAKKKK